MAKIFGKINHFRYLWQVNGGIVILQMNAEPTENLWRFHAVPSAKAGIELLGSENAIELITGVFTGKITPNRGV